MASLLEDHYETLVEERGHESADFAIGDLPAAYVERTFACADGARAFASNLADGRRSLVTVGVSMTGPPHVGTLGQLLTAIRFQEAGFDVQLVLADLAAYNAAGRDLETVRTLAENYRSFALALGFDPVAGTVQTQSEATNVLRTVQLLSRYFDPDAGGDDREPTAFERELANVYDAADTPGEETTEFAGDQTALLLVADTLAPVVTGACENVLFVGGADNHGLAAFFRRVLDRTPYEATVAGLYTGLVPGLDGYPKMSKSLPDSNVSLDADPDDLRAAVLDAAGESAAPERSRTYQMMRLASDHSAAELDRLAEQCARGGSEWERSTAAYAEYLVDVAASWSE